MEKNIFLLVRATSDDTREETNLKRGQRQKTTTENTVEKFG